MKIDRALVLTLGVAAVSSACAAAASGPRITVPPPEVMCGTGPLTSFVLADSAAATLALVGTAAEEEQPARYALALGQAQRAVAMQPENPYGYYLAGQAALGVEDFAVAEQMLDRAVQLCPALEAETENFRAVGASQAFERAGSLLTAGSDTAGAIAAYEASLRFFPGNYPADFYLGLINFQRQDTDAAVRHWRRVIQTIDETAPSDDAEAMAERASARANAQNALLFAARQYLERDMTDQALSLLGEIRRAAPNNAEAAYYHALALNTMQRWSELLPVAREATELAPLSYGALILYYNAFAGQSQAASQANNTTQAAELARQARDVSNQSENMPVQLEAVGFDVTTEGTEVTGTAVGTGQTAPVQVEFILHGTDGVVARGTHTITPPAAQQQEPFTLTIDSTAPVTGLSYRVIGG